MALKKAAKKKTIRKISIKTGRVKKMAQNSSKDGVFAYLGFGTLFGYFLSKARATDFDSIVDMFLCREFQLYGVILTAIAVISLGLWFMRKKNIPTKSGEAFNGEPLEWDPNRLIGAFVFGAGWALTGTCPGTSLAQIGEGKIMAVFTVLGILAGVWAYKKYKPGSSKEQVC